MASSFSSATARGRRTPLGGWPAAAVSRTAASPVPWAAIAVAAPFFIAAAAIVVRGCNYAIGLPVAYAGYFALQVMLPGAMAMLLFRQPLSLSSIVALAIPTGFALEIATFLGLSALHATNLMRIAPVVWAFIGIAAYLRAGDTRWEPRASSSRLATFVLCAIGLVTVIAAAGHVYAEAPLVAGLPQRPIFHDWMYLLSRASAIKTQWPLEDPSLAGTPLQYHYFLLVHVAAAAKGLGTETTWVLLRLVPIPLGLVLVAQIYVLGRRFGASIGVGALAAFLLLVPGEVSSAHDYGSLTYLGFFLRWLYVSPTFLFGLIFFGGLAMVISELDANIRWPTLIWLMLLAGGATAAKGPVVPVVLVALTLHAALQWIYDRRAPISLFWTMAAIAVGFLAVYTVTLSACGNGDAEIQPFRLCEVTPFWEHHAVIWQRWLKRTLHAPTLGTWLGKSAAAACILAGTVGIKAIAIPHLAWIGRSRRRQATWLVALVIASTAFGLTLHFDGDSEIYFLFLAEVPLAVLAAAALVEGARWLWHRWTQSASRARRLAWASVGVTAALATSVVLVIQITATVRCESAGIRDWANMRTDLNINDDLRPLYEMTSWVRTHTEQNAILVSNTVTLDTMGRGRGVPVDHTTVGVNYNLSALTERQLWVEGPSYLLDTAEARARLVAATRFFRDGTPLPAKWDAGTPLYVVVDHTIDHGTAIPTVGRGVRVFANGRFDLFRLLATAPTLASTKP